MTAANRAEYVRLYCDFLLRGAVAGQVRAFERGLLRLPSAEFAMKLCWAEELEMLVCGDQATVDFGALRRAARYVGAFACGRARRRRRSSARGGAHACRRRLHG